MSQMFLILVCLPFKIKSQVTWRLQALLWPLSIPACFCISLTISSLSKWNYLGLPEGTTSCVFSTWAHPSDCSLKKSQVSSDVTSPGSLRLRHTVHRTPFSVCSLSTFLATVRWFFSHTALWAASMQSGHCVAVDPLCFPSAQQSVWLTVSVHTLINEKNEWLKSPVIISISPIFKKFPS